MGLLSSNNRKIRKGSKISCLRSLNIKFDIKDDNDINEKFAYLCNDKEYIGSSYLAKLYKEGQDIVNFENRMFAIKDSYISMIGQLLCDNQFENCPYELVKTEGTTPDFEYMLAIDDKELSYYIEVHMPTFIAKKLIDKYKMKFSEERSFERLGASAVYKRDYREIRNIFDEVNSNELEETSRTIIITRDSGDEDTFSIPEENNSEDNKYD